MKPSSPSAAPAGAHHVNKHYRYLLHSTMAICMNMACLLLSLTLQLVTSPTRHQLVNLTISKPDAAKDMAIIVHPRQLMFQFDSKGAAVRDKLPPAVTTRESCCGLWVMLLCCKAISAAFLYDQSMSILGNCLNVIHQSSFQTCMPLPHVVWVFIPPEQGVP